MASTAARVHFDGVKIFSVSDSRRRATVDDEVTQWLSGQPGIEVMEILVKQSSDSTHHCLTICVFYRDPPTGKRAAVLHG